VGNGHFLDNAVGPGHLMRDRLSAINPHLYPADSDSNRQMSSRSPSPTSKHFHGQNVRPIVLHERSRIQFEDLIRSCDIFGVRKLLPIQPHIRPVIDSVKMQPHPSAPEVRR
jgi:hypothetical protein